MSNDFSLSSVCDPEISNSSLRIIRNRDKPFENYCHKEFKSGFQFNKSTVMDIHSIDLNIYPLILKLNLFYELITL